jgi:hypothetical protein
MTAAILESRAAPPPASAAASEGPVLNFGWFAAPYLVSIVYFFTMLKDDSHVLAPVLPIAVVVAGAVVTAIVERRPPRLNYDVAWLVLAYCAVCLVSMAMHQSNDSFALRKLGLPLVGMAPAIFRYYVTPRQILLFMIALALVAWFYTTETPDVVATGFFSTDSPDESILGVTFGAIAVWLAASNRWSLAAFAYAACLLFFKRNAIVAAPIIVVLLVALQLLRPSPLRTLRRITAGTAIVMAVLALYLGDLFDFIAANLVRGYSAEFLSVGREPLYDAILGDFARSDVSEQLLGHGPGAVEHLVGNLVFLHVDLQLAHDEYLSWLYDFGAVGLALLLFFFMRIGRGGIPAVAVLLFVATTMVAENYFLVSFNCLGVFVLFSTNLVARGGAAQAP